MTTRRPDWRRSARAGSTALVVVALTAASRAALAPLLGDDSPWRWYLVSVLIAAGSSGSGAAALALVLGAVAAVTVPPRGTDLDPWAPAFFLVTGAIAIAVQERTRRSRSGPTPLGVSTEGLLDAVPIGIGWLDLELNLVAANATLIGLPGRSVEPPDQRSAAAMLPGYWEALEPLCRRTLESGVPHREHEIGGPQPVLASVTPVQVPGRGTIGLGLALVDLTARTAAESRHRDQEERLRQLAENLDDVVYIADQNQPRMEYVSPSYERIWGRSRESLYRDPRSFLDAIHPEDRRRMVEGVGRQLAGQPSVEEYRIGRPDGEERWIRDRAIPIVDSLGRTVRIVGLAEDITERKCVADEREHDRSLLDALFAASPVGLAILDDQFRFLRVNEVLARINGKPIADHLGRSVAEVVPNLFEKAESIYRSVLATGQPIRDLEIAGPDPRRPGHTGYWLGDYFPIRTPAGVVGIGIMIVEVTGSRQAQEALRLSEARFRRLYESGVVGVGISHADGRWLEANDELLRLSGATRGSLDAGTFRWRDATPTEYLSLDAKAIEECRQRGACTPFEKEYIRQDGSRVPVLIGFATIDGLEDRYIVTVQDLTQSKAAEARMRASEATLRAFYESSPLCMGVVELVGDDIRHLYDNPATCGFFGVEPGTTGGRLSSELGVPPEVIQRWLGHYRQSGSLGGPVHFETESLTAAGDRWLSVMVCPIGPGTPTPVRYCYVAQDITERKQAATRLEAQLELTRTITDNATTAIFMLDTSGRCTFMNPSAEAMTGYPFAEAEGRILHDLVQHHPPDGRPASIANRPVDRPVLHEFNLRGHEGVFVRKDGQCFPVLCNARPIRRGDAAAGTVLEVRDITQEKEAEGRIRRLFDDLHEQDRRKDEFLAMLAHELRNPLAPIRNAISILDEAEDDSATLQWARAVIDRQVRHLTSLVDDLLDVSRITQGKITLTKTHLGVSTFLEAAVEASRPLFDARGQTLEFTLPEAGLAVEGDATRLAQVVLNLLNNAAKYTPEGGRTSLSAAPEGDFVAIRVADTGMGIPAEMLPRIFDLFTQVSRSIDRAEGGLGIGLTLVRRLVAMHGGTVEATSPGLGAGSEFVVRLPLAVGSAPAEAPPDRPPARPGRRRRVLIVDDNLDARTTLARLLRRLGHETEMAGDGPSAVRTTLELRPDLVLLDIGLPGMDGYEVARRLRAEPTLEGLTLIALTGYGTEADRRQSAAAGFDAHLVKPVEPESLRQLLA